MKKEILEKCIHKEMLCKEGAKLLFMHPKAFSRLKSRYQKEGEKALIPQKPGPKHFHPPNKTPEWIEELVENAACKNRHLGPLPISEILEDDYDIIIDSTTVWRILKRRKVRYFCQYQPREKIPPHLYCLEMPGEELQLDGSYPFGRSRKLVCFSAIDDCSRYVFSRRYDRETADNAILFVTELVERAPFRIQRIRVDNRYGKKLKEYCENILSIEVIHNDSYAPKQNGKVERFHKTLKHSFFWRYCSCYESVESIHYKLFYWLHYYNYQRHHGGYGMKRITPAQKIASSLLYQSSYLLIHNYPQKVTCTCNSTVFDIFCKIC